MMILVNIFKFKKQGNLFLFLFFLLFSSSIFLNNSFAQYKNSRYSINERFRAVTLIGDYLIKLQNNKKGYLYPPFCDAHPKGCAERIKIYVKYIFDAAQEDDLDPWLLIAIAVHSTQFDATKITEIGQGGLLRLRKENRGHGYLRFFKEPEICSILETDACQKRVIRQSARILKESLFFCNKDISKAINKYYNGTDCVANKPLSKEVLDIKNKFYLKGRSIPALCSNDICTKLAAEKTDFTFP